MKIKYLPKNIFLDTNIYEKFNFLHGTKIHNLFEYSKKGIVKLYMTKISYLELRERIQVNLEKAVKEQKGFVDSINKTRILRNLNRYDNIVKPTLNIPEALNEIFKKLDNLIECCDVELIDSNIVDTESVFDLYFRSLSPFSIHDKKYEFPDAFIIKTVDKWCEINSTKMIFVTKDNDFNNYKSSRIIFKHDLIELLDDISIYYDSICSDQILPEINRRVKHFEDELLSKIDVELEEKVSVDLVSCDFFNLKFSKPIFVDYKVTSIMPEYADVSYNVKVSFSVDVFPTEKDVHQTVFPDNIKPKRIISEVVLPCEFEFRFNHKNNIKLKWINSNEPINLRLDLSY